MSALEAIDRGLRSVRHVAAVLTGAMAVAVLAMIVLRQAFQIPAPFLFEGTEFAVLFVTMLAAAPLASQDGHIRVDVLSGQRGSRRWRVTELLSASITLAFTLLLAVGSAYLTLESLERGHAMMTTLQPPRWTVMWVIPVGMALLAVRQVITIARVLRGEEPYAEDETTDVGL